LLRRTVVVAILLTVLGATALHLNHAGSKVAFMGDSLTEGWEFPRVNLGVHGQTTAEMVQRFPAQVAGHGFRRVVILGGTNDTLLGIDPAITLANLKTMIEMARQAGVEPVLAEIPPIYSGGGQHLGAVARLNAGIALLAPEQGVTLVDYYDTLNGEPQDFSDGTHLKRRGYARMEWALLQVTNPF
jgi:lysophospholipase L1-like esterase